MDIKFLNNLQSYRAKIDFVDVSRWLFNLLLLSIIPGQVMLATMPIASIVSTLSLEATETACLTVVLLE